MTDHFHTSKDELAVFWIPADTDIPMELKVIENSWQAMKALVGGFIEPMPLEFTGIDDLKCGCSLRLLVDEEAISRRREHNLRATTLWHPPKYRAPEYLLGDAILVAEGPSKQPQADEPVLDFWGLPEQMKLWEGPGSGLPAGV